MDNISQSTTREFLFYCVLWGLLCIFQAWWTPIHADEAYYWCFSKTLAWGYFDHPPITALIIKISSFLFSGILGVRALTIVVQLLSLYLIFHLIDKENNNINKIKNFWTFIFCLPLFHIYGFITTPDVPLIFFGALFLNFYKKVIQTNKTSYYILWGITMGLMLLSKYHGVLLIFFIILSNPKILLNPKIYLAGGIGLTIWSPHIYWQYLNDWITFKFHLIERANNPKWFYPLEYIGNSLLIFNPFLIVLLVRVVTKKWSNLFERGLYFTLIGFIIFFGIQTFRDHVQPQWLVLTYIPLTVLLLNHLGEQQEFLLRRAFKISLPLLALAHVLLSIDLLPNDLDIFRQREAMEKIKEDAKGKPVVFINSYQNASLYNWYHKDDYAHSYSIVSSRKSQYSIWLKDTIHNNQEVFVPNKAGVKMQPNNHKKNGSFNSYLSFDKIKIKSEEDKFNTNGLFSIKIENSYNYQHIFSANELNILIVLYKKKRPIAHIQCKALNTYILEQSTNSKIKVDFGDLSSFDADAYGFAVTKHPWAVGAVYYRYPIH